MRTVVPARVVRSGGIGTPPFLVAAYARLLYRVFVRLVSIIWVLGGAAGSAALKPQLPPKIRPSGSTRKSVPKAATPLPAWTTAAVYGAHPITVVWSVGTNGPPPLLPQPLRRRVTDSGGSDPVMEVQ